MMLQVGLGMHAYLPILLSWILECSIFSSLAISPCILNHYPWVFNTFSNAFFVFWQLKTITPPWQFILACLFLKCHLNAQNDLLQNSDWHLTVNCSCSYMERLLSSEEKTLLEVCRVGMILFFSGCWKSFWKISLAFMGMMSSVLSFWFKLAYFHTFEGLRHTLYIWQALH